MTTNFYPRSLTNFCNRISNYSRNTFKVLPYRTDGITQSQILVADLPSNSLCDLETLCLRFNLTTTTTAGFATPSKHIETLIDKIVVEIGGVSIGSCSSLNHVYDMLLNYQNGSDLKSKRKIYQAGAGAVVDYTANPTVVGIPTANLTNVPFAVHNFLGFVSSAQPTVLDTAITSNVRIHIYLAPASVLAMSAAGAGLAYSLNSVYYTIDTISIDDNIFYNLHNEFLENGGVYEIPFQSIYTAMFSVASTSQSSRFSINTGSLDMISACFLPTANTSVYEATSKTAGTWKKQGTDVTTYQFEINGISVPQFSASVDDCLPLTLNALCLSQDVLGGIDSDITCSTVYKSHYWAPFVRLNHPTSDDERCVSGMNTNGNSASIVFKTTGGALNANLLITAFSTSILQVSAGRAIQVIS